MDGKLPITTFSWSLYCTSALCLALTLANRCFQSYAHLAPLAGVG
ncbi:MAG: hypothetical protein NVS3B5_13910 [Sphingomicrobium sp.]